jgi:hypothetical protein
VARKTPQPPHPSGQKRLQLCSPARLFPRTYYKAIEYDSRTAMSSENRWHSPCGYPAQRSGSGNSSLGSRHRASAVEHLKPQPLRPHHAAPAKDSRSNNTSRISVDALRDGSLNISEGHRFSFAATPLAPSFVRRNCRSRCSGWHAGGKDKRRSGFEPTNHRFFSAAMRV